MDNYIVSVLLIPAGELGDVCASKEFRVTGETYEDAMQNALCQWAGSLGYSLKRSTQIEAANMICSICIGPIERLRDMSHDEVKMWHTKCDIKDGG